MKITDTIGGKRGCSPANKTHGMSGTPIYVCWNSMIGRCTRPNHKDYKDYGARGITICDRWLVFENFYLDMAPIHAPGMTIDRRDNNLGYSPDNCRWVSNKVQQRNKRNNRLFTYKGETLCIGEWAERFGMSRTVLHDRLKAGMSIEQALETPVKKYRPRKTSKLSR
jgi:AraC-like DNA-binding protein